MVRLLTALLYLTVGMMALKLDIDDLKSRGFKLAKS
jgi:hypothetical protein